MMALEVQALEVPCFCILALLAHRKQLHYTVAIHEGTEKEERAILVNFLYALLIALYVSLL